MGVSPRVLQQATLPALCPQFAKHLIERLVLAALDGGDAAALHLGVVPHHHVVHGVAAAEPLPPDAEMKLMVAAWWCPTQK